MTVAGGSQPTPVPNDSSLRLQQLVANSESDQARGRSYVEFAHGGGSVRLGGLDADA